MTLDEFMETADDSRLYYIGSLSGYVFIGTKAEYFEDVDRLSKSHLQMVTHNMRLNKFYYKNSIKSRAVFYKSRYENYKERVKNFIPFREREIMDTYDKTTDDGLVILVSGDEIGQYWFKHEYDHTERGIN